MSSEAESKTFLQTQAAKMREELMKVAEKVKGLPQVQQAIAMYDVQMEKLNTAMDTESAKKIFDVLTVAKNVLIKAIETAQASPVGIVLMHKLQEYQSIAQSKLIKA
jgi:Zn-dependent M32 family carboxypeptidase